MVGVSEEMASPISRPLCFRSGSLLKSRTHVDAKFDGFENRLRRLAKVSFEMLIRQVRKGEIRETDFFECGWFSVGLSVINETLPDPVLA